MPCATCLPTFATALAYLRRWNRSTCLFQMLITHIKVDAALPMCSCNASLAAVLMRWTSRFPHPTVASCLVLPPVRAMRPRLITRPRNDLSATLHCSAHVTASFSCRWFSSRLGFVGRLPNASSASCWPGPLSRGGRRVPSRPFSYASALVSPSVARLRKPCCAECRLRHRPLQPLALPLSWLWPLPQPQSLLRRSSPPGRRGHTRRR